MEKIKDNKNKIKPKTKSKTLVLGLLILFTIIGIGVFSPAEKASAASDKDLGTCVHEVVIDSSKTPPVTRQKTETTSRGWCQGANGQFTFTAPATPSGTTAAASAGTTNNKNYNEFETQANKFECGYTDMKGCLVYVVYVLFYVVPSLLLVVAAMFFDFMLSMGLSSTMIKGSTFIVKGWTAVRDLSNIFFILILLYVAVKMILGIGEHEVKKTISQVIIMALLINFSMFFTGVVIDTSNMLALIFYNKLTVSTKNDTPKQLDPKVSSIPAKDISGTMVASFNPTSGLTWTNFFEQARNPIINGAHVEVKLSDTSTLMVEICLISGAIMAFAAYAFFMTGISFMGRFIELWVLIIFSPFAFMSFATPLFDGVEYLGWKAWSKRLLEVCFMAPIFMFFMYLIFLMLQPPGLFGNLITAQSTVETLIMIIIPAATILILLNKATEFAKKGSGMAGEMLMKGAKLAGGLALGAAGIAGGAALGGAAIAGRASLGKIGASVSNSRWAKNMEANGGNALSRFTGARLRDAGKMAGSASFDARGIKIAGKTIASATGMSLGEGHKGGFEQKRKEQVEKKQKRAKELEVGEDEPEMQTVRERENDLQAAKADPARQERLLTLNEGDGTPNMPSLGNLERASTTAEKALADAERALRDAVNGNGQDVGQARNNQARAEAAKNTARDALVTRQNDIRGEGHEIHNAEVALKRAQNEVTGISNTRRQNFATNSTSGLSQTVSFILSGGQHSVRGAREASNKIRANAKIESSSHGSGGGGHSPAAPTAHRPAPAAHGPAPAAHGPAPAAHGPAH